MRILIFQNKNHKTYTFYRYLGQDEDIELQEKLADMELDIDDANERMGKAKGKLKATEVKHDNLKKNLIRLASVVTGNEQGMETSNKLLGICHTGLETVLTRLLGVDLRAVQDEMEEVGFKPTGPEFADDFKYDKKHLGVKLLFLSRDLEDQRKKRRGADQDDGPDDDEVEPWNCNNLC